MASGPYAGVGSRTTAGPARSPRIASAINQLRERSNSLARRSVAASRSLGSVMAMRANGIVTYPVSPGMSRSYEWGRKLARAVVLTLKNGPLGSGPRAVGTTAMAVKTPMGCAASAAQRELTAQRLVRTMQPHAGVVGGDTGPARARRSRRPHHVHAHDRRSVFRPQR